MRKAIYLVFDKAFPHWKAHRNLWLIALSHGRSSRPTETHISRPCPFVRGRRVMASPAPALTLPAYSSPHPEENQQGSSTTLSGPDSPVHPPRREKQHTYSIRMYSVCLGKVESINRSCWFGVFPSPPLVNCQPRSRGTSYGPRVGRIPRSLSKMYDDFVITHSAGIGSAAENPQDCRFVTSLASFSRVMIVARSAPSSEREERTQPA